jgi:diacylglycerol kinase family enzyme
VETLRAEEATQATQTLIPDEPKPGQPPPEHADPGEHAMTVVAAIVGIDGCGKSSVFRGALDRLSGRIAVAGVGDEVLSGRPGHPLHARDDIPASRFTRSVGRVAKGTRWSGLYKNLKFLELTERTRQSDYLATHEAPAAILTDGCPLVNSAAWAAARYYRGELAGDDDALYDALEHLAGERAIPLRRAPFYLRRAWQLPLLNWLRLGRYNFPDRIFLLQIDPTIAMARIRARGKPLQAHETEPFLGELAAAYERVCRLLETRRGIEVVRLPVGETALDETAGIVAEEILRQIERNNEDTSAGAGPETIEVIATTMSGSLKDQRKVGRIGPEFRARTERPVRVHLANTHAEARDLAHAAVVDGGRILVSAGGAGTFNAVLEGAHVDGAIPPDLRLAFLRKGSADLIGKTLRIPDNLPGAVTAIMAGVERDCLTTADVLAVETAEPDGAVQRRHLVGFGGFGLFGDVPRFTESRFIKYYKGILGTLFGDLGPFFVGLALAAIRWRIQRTLGRAPRLVLTLDGEPTPAREWGAVVVMNGDLGKDFPLGRGLPLGSGAFRVIALPYLGLRPMLRQIVACRTGRIIDDPERFGALVRTVRTLRVQPLGDQREAMVNVDGLKLLTRGDVTVTVAGQARLVAAPAG